MLNPGDPGYVEEVLSGETVSKPDTPAYMISHALDPRTPENRETAICGAPWVPASNIGGQPLMCADCIRIAIDAGLAQRYGVDQTR
jgi:hypothetical protein